MYRIQQDVCYVHFDDARDNAYIYSPRGFYKLVLCVSLCEPVCTMCVYTVVIESINLITSPRADALARYTVERERATLHMQ